jgi:hypothetical protein
VYNCPCPAFTHSFTGQQLAIDGKSAVPTMNVQNVPKRHALMGLGSAMWMYLSAREAEVGLLYLLSETEIIATQIRVLGEGGGWKGGGMEVVFGA